MAQLYGIIKIGVSPTITDANVQYLRDTDLGLSMGSSSNAVTSQPFKGEAATLDRTTITAGTGYSIGKSVTLVQNATSGSGAGLVIQANISGSNSCSIKPNVEHIQNLTPTTQNLLNNYGSKVDAKLSYSGYYDFYLAADERDFQREVVYSDNIIGYEEPRTPQVGNRSNTLPLWIDLNNTASTTQPLLTAVTFNQQTGWWDRISGNPATFNYGLTSTGFPQTVISQNYWGQALSYCDCPYENDEDQYNVNNYPLNAVDIGQYETMLVNDSTQISLWGPSVPISGLCSSSAKYSALTYYEQLVMFEVLL